MALERVENALQWQCNLQGGTASPEHNPSSMIIFQVARWHESSRFVGGLELELSYATVSLVKLCVLLVLQLLDKACRSWPNQEG